jgi:hypothetical protein
VGREAITDPSRPHAALTLRHYTLPANEWRSELRLAAGTPAEALATVRPLWMPAVLQRDGRSGPAGPSSGRMPRPTGWRRTNGSRCTVRCQGPWSKTPRSADLDDLSQQRPTASQTVHAADLNAVSAQTITASDVPIGAGRSPQSDRPWQKSAAAPLVGGQRGWDMVDDTGPCCWMRRSGCWPGRLTVEHLEAGYSYARFLPMEQLPMEMGNLRPPQGTTRP